MQHDLAKMGYTVTLFEACINPEEYLFMEYQSLGLPKSIVEYEVDEIEKLGVEVICDQVS